MCQWAAYQPLVCNGRNDRFVSLGAGLLAYHGSFTSFLRFGGLWVNTLNRGLMGWRPFKQLWPRCRQCVMEANRSVRRATVFEVEVASTVGGVTTSMIWSAMSSSLASWVVVLAEAEVIRTLEGWHCKKSSFRKAFSMGRPIWSPNSCCIWLNSCVSFLSLSSSPLISCCSLCCSEGSLCDQPSFEGVVTAVFWGVYEKIPDFMGDLWREGL